MSKINFTYLIIIATFLWTRPQLLARHLLSELSKILIASELLDNRKEINRWIIPGSLRSGVAQEAFVVQLFHVLHSLLR